MSSLIGGGARVAPQVVETPKPEIVDNSAKTLDEERKRRRRSGAATQFLAGNDNLNGINVGKTTLGA